MFGGANTYLVHSCGILRRHHHSCRRPNLFAAPSSAFEDICCECINPDRLCLVYVVTAARLRKAPHVNQTRSCSSRSRLLAPTIEILTVEREHQKGPKFHFTMGSPKKVEFASTHLEPIDSEAPTESGTIGSGSAPQPSGAWDTETGGCGIFGCYNSHPTA